MDKNFFKKCLLLSSSFLITFCIAIIVNSLLKDMQSVGNKLYEWYRILRPILYGVMMAYLLKPMCNFFKTKYTILFNYIYTTYYKSQKKDIEKETKKRRETTILLISIFTSIIIVISIIILIFCMIIPQIVESIPTMIETITNGIKNVETFLEDNQNNIIIGQIDKLILESNLEDYFDLNNIMTNYIAPYVSQFMQNLSAGTIEFASKIKDLLVGLFVAIYILTSTKKLGHQAKMILYGVFPTKVANFILDEIIYADNAFNGFLVGKIIDSAIIGIITYISMFVLRIPYALLIAVIVGVTNIIPIFGPFIGAVPPLFLLIFTEPTKAIIFLIFILVLQQIDGQFIGPKIIGKAIGMSSLWVLVSIIIFGGLFGILGMIIGAPLFAVIYDLIKRGVVELLKRKNIKSSELLMPMKCIDASTIDTKDKNE